MVLKAPNRPWVFVGGLHRSGTTLITASLAKHQAVTPLHDTGVPEDEGQHLQGLYPPAHALGGPGLFGWSVGGHLTECDVLDPHAARQHLAHAWEPYLYDRPGTAIEKSPPNLIRTRFLRTVFPDSKHIIVIRHPIPTALATRQWVQASLEDLIRHWATCYHLARLDTLTSSDVLWVRYEDFVKDPDQVISGVHEFLGLPAAPSQVAVHSGLNEKYFRAMRKGLRQTKRGSRRRALKRLEPLANSFGYSLDSPEPAEDSGFYDRCMG